MGKTIKKVSREFKGMSGTDIKYLKRSREYGHLDAGHSKSKYRRSK